MIEQPGRSCPLSYRYGASRIASSPLQPVQTLYVVGGLYGNVQALDAIEAMAAQESGPVTICFNGDFNWFNRDPGLFELVNRRVLAHAAIVGNVEAELLADSDDAGCGCGYPDDVDADTVNRSNLIHADLKRVAQEHPDVQARLAGLGMFTRFQVGPVRVAVVHGDSNALAGWDFDVRRLAQCARDLGSAAVLHQAFESAQVEVFASSHTCQPALWRDVMPTQTRVVVNNGAAGMPNFEGSQTGLITRIGVEPSVHQPSYSTECGSVQVQALEVAYDRTAWMEDFLRQWPEGSPAHTSYYARMLGKTGFSAHQAVVSTA